MASLYWKLNEYNMLQLSNTPTSGYSVWTTSSYSSYQTKVVGVAGSGTIILPADCTKMFFNCTNLTSIGPNLDFSEVTKCNRMFYGCTKLSLFHNTSDIDMSNVTDCNCMFYSCTSLPQREFDKLNIKNVGISNEDWAVDYSNMFNSCPLLTSMDMSTWNMSHSTLLGMFYGCVSLTNVKFPSRVVTDDTFDMFNRCSVLTSVDVSSWDVSAVEGKCNYQSMFQNCELLEHIYAKPNTNWESEMKPDSSTTYLFKGATKLPNYDASDYYNRINHANNINSLGYFENAPSEGQWYRKVSGTWQEGTLYKKISGEWKVQEG